MVHEPLDTDPSMKASNVCNLGDEAQDRDVSSLLVGLAMAIEEGLSWVGILGQILNLGLFAEESSSFQICSVVWLLCSSKEESGKFLLVALPDGFDQLNL